MCASAAPAAAPAAVPAEGKASPTRALHVSGTHLFLGGLLALATVVSFREAVAAGEAANGKGGRSPAHVWWYGWLTALSTGLGALPMVFFSVISDWWLGIANALAAGMMLSASAALLLEAIAIDTPAGSAVPSWLSAVIGGLVGIVTIVVSQRVLERYDDVKFGILDGVNARKVLLILAVMTIHSFSEGLGLGVSFGEHSTQTLGMLVTTTLAVHNVPEGFAVSVVLVSRGMSVPGAALWSVFTSLPQPLMAVAGYWFVDSFAAVQPGGLGFAAGAMVWVALIELLADAWSSCGLLPTATVMTIAAGFMSVAHDYLS